MDSSKVPIGEPVAPGQGIGQDMPQPSGAPPPYSHLDIQPSPKQQIFIPSGERQHGQYGQSAIIVEQQPTMHVTSQPGPFIIVNTGIIHSARPIRMECPNCRQSVVTQVAYESGTLTWLACFGCVLVGCSLGCCFIPFCMDEMQDAVHSCPNCQQFIGRYRRL